MENEDRYLRNANAVLVADPDAAEERVRVVRVLVMEGTRSWVEKTLARSISIGAPRVLDNGCSIKEVARCIGDLELGVNGQ